MKMDGADEDAGVTDGGDILLLEESDIAALSADLRKIQATKFGLALEALRGGAPVDAVAAGGVSTNNNPAAVVPAEQHIIVAQRQEPRDSNSFPTMTGMLNPAHDSKSFPTMPGMFDPATTMPWCHHHR